MYDNQNYRKSVIPKKHMINQIQMNQRGIIVVPKKVRDAYQLGAGAVFTMIDLGEGAFVLMPKQSQVTILADDIRAALKAKGETLESMLMALREARESHG